MQPPYRRVFHDSPGRQMTTRRRLVRSLSLVALVAMTFAADARAQSYPNRPVTFVVPFAPGGLTDVPARVLAAEMQERIRVPIVVENKPGASGLFSDRKSTRLNSSHLGISYAVFCLKKKKHTPIHHQRT